MPNPDAADALVDEALDHLARAVRDRDDPFRNLQLATVSPEGSPGLRTVVLRACEFPRDSPGPVLEFHTDREAGKVRALAARPDAVLLAWSARTGLQLRIDGRARIHAGDPLAAARWAGLGERARATYAFAVPPGTPIDDPDHPPSHADDAARFARFAVVRVEAHALDVLRLGAHGARTRAIRACRPGSRAAFVCP